MSKKSRVKFVDDLKLSYEVKPIVLRVDKEHKWNRAKQKEDLRKKVDKEMEH